MENIRYLLPAPRARRDIEHPSNPISLRIRTVIERLNFRQFIGVNLAGVAFFAAVVLPQADELSGAFEVAQSVPSSVVEVVPTEARFQWPMVRFGLSQRFSLGHPGIDLTAPLGSAVFPISDGWVSWTSESKFGYGNHVLVEHGDGVKSLYAHLSYTNVTPGETLNKETQIGEVGSTGWATGDHLHLEVYENGIPANPLNVLPELK
jgi:murein DD-endopeptidase MepM/ murein hydrolase activator NlpD